MLLKLVCVLSMLCVFRDSGKSLDIFDEKLHPLSVSMLIRFPQTESKSLHFELIRKTGERRVIPSTSGFD